MRILNRSLDIIFVVYYGVDSTRTSQIGVTKLFLKKLFSTDGMNIILRKIDNM